MRGITANGLTKAQSTRRIDPTLLVRVEFATETRWFADKDLILGTIVAKGWISDLSNLQSRRKQDFQGSVTSIKIKLIDFDGSLKVLFDQNNLEYTPCSVWLHFEGLAQADLSLLFKGCIASPIEWSEGKRELSFEVETKLKDNEVGFAVETIPPTDPSDIYVPINPSIENLNPDVVNKAWPLCFGNVVFVPALLLQTAPRGYLKYPFKGPRDPSQSPTSDPYWDDTHFYLQDADGALFPQSKPGHAPRLIDVIIDGWVFRGTLYQDTFTVSEANVPKYVDVLFGDRDPDDPDSILANVAWLLEPLPLVNNWCLYKDEFGDQQYFRIIRQDSYIGKDTVTEYHKIQFDRAIILPTSGAPRYFKLGDKIDEVAQHGRQGWADVWETGFGDGSLSGSTSGAIFPGGFGIGDMGDFGPIQSAPNPSSKRIHQTTDLLSHVPWKFNAGAEVRLWKPSHADVWVANLIPTATVVAVYVDKTNKEGVKQRVPLHKDYYVVSQPTMAIENADGTTTSVHPTLVTIDPPLREFVGQKWGEQVYVVLKSTVGPNTADIIKWLLDTWSTLPTDAVSFAAVATKITNYPSNFAIFQKENVLKLVEEIAVRARCGLRLDTGTAEIVYLSEKPAAVLTLAEGKVEQRTLALQVQKTEDIYTRLQADYKLTYYPTKQFEKTFFYRKNVDAFGLRKKQMDFFIYNIPSLVEKSAKWLGARYAQAWRTAKLMASLDAVPLEIHDGIDVTFADTSLLGTSWRAVVDGVSVGQEVVELEMTLPSVAGTSVEATDFWMDDSADVDPGDPTAKYLPSPAAILLADDESRFRALTQVTAGDTVPGIVVSYVNLDGAGNPINTSMVDVPPDASIAPDGTVTGGTPPVAPGTKIYTVDTYSDGYAKPKTGTVYATAVDPTNPPAPPQKVDVVQSNGKNYVSTGGGGGSFPAKITSLGPPGTGGPYPTPCITVDLYEDGIFNTAGHALAATRENIGAFPIFALENYLVLDDCMVFIDRGLYYAVDVPVSGQQEFPAKVVNVISPSVVQVDLYENKFDHLPTLTARSATIVDQNSWGNFIITDQVSVFLDKGNYWVSTCKPFNPDSLPPNMDGQITGFISPGVYKWKQTIGPGTNTFVTGAVDRSATGCSLSPVLEIGEDVLITNLGVNGFRINKPHGACAV